MNLSKLVLVRAMQTNSQGQTRLPNIPANTKCILVYQYTESKRINPEHSICLSPILFQLCFKNNIYISNVSSNYLYYITIVVWHLINKYFPNAVLTYSTCTYDLVAEKYNVTRTEFVLNIQCPDTTTRLSVLHLFLMAWWTCMLGNRWRDGCWNVPGIS